MQSTGQTSTQAVSFTPTQGSMMMCVISKASFGRSKRCGDYTEGCSRTVQESPWRECRDLGLVLFEGQPGDLARRPRGEENAVAEVARGHHRRPARQRPEDRQAVGCRGTQAGPDGLQPGPAAAGEEPADEGEEILDAIHRVVLVEARLLLRLAHQQA